MTKEPKKAKNEAKEEIVATEQSSEKKTVSTKKEEGKVGLLLKEMRNKQGKTFSEISQDLCIRQNYLKAIEESDYNNIPEYPYGIGFIRSYADYLGLDGNNIVKMYKEEAEADFRKKHPYFVMEPQIEATVPSKKYLLISLIALILVYGAWSLYNQYAYMEEEVSSSERMSAEVTEDTNVNFPLKVEDYSTNAEVIEAEEQETPKQTEAEEPKEELPIVDVSSVEENQQVTVTNKSFEEQETVKEKTEAEQPEAVKSEEKVQSTDKVKTAKSELVLNILKETWIEVRNDKTLYISKVLQGGDSYTLPKADNLKLSVGRADGVKVLYEGKEIYKFSPNKKMNISVDEIISKAED